MKRAEINLPPQQLPALTLAYVGDAVYELYVRNSILKQSHKVHTLHRLAINRVNNNTQSDLLAKVESELTEEELAVVHRGRNAKGAQVPKNASPQIYRRSSGLIFVFKRAGRTLGMVIEPDRRCSYQVKEDTL